MKLSNQNPLKNFQMKKSKIESHSCNRCRGTLEEKKRWKLLVGISSLITGGFLVCAASCCKMVLILSDIFYKKSPVVIFIV